MVTKQARAIDSNDITTTIGSHDYLRINGDFNLHTDENAGLRINAMHTAANNNGAGASIEKSGIAINYRGGIRPADAFSTSLYHLDSRNGTNYGLPWIRPTASSPRSEISLRARPTMWRSTIPTDSSSTANARRRSGGQLPPRPVLWRDPFRRHESQCQ